MHGHDILATVSRNERRLLLRREEQSRKTGAWGEWETLTFLPGSAGKGWAADFTTAHRNRVFSVLDRTLPNGVRHLAVSSLTQVRPSWWEMQRIKNEIAGNERTAVEVYPPQGDVVDGADMFHIWVLPMSLDFGLTS